ncbi:MAG: hypothetical protein WDO16_24085 [Bacteroidota bacterium]
MALRKITLLCTLIIYCLTQAAYAQKPKEVLKWINTIQAGSENFYYEIPFEYRNDHIVIRVKIGNEMYDYVFDTGGYNDITDDIQNKNNFPVLTTQTVGSANKLKAKVNIVKVDSLSIGELVITDLAALQMNFENVPSMCGINGAIIGASIIKKFAWRIDFPRKKMIVTDDFSRLPVLANTIKVPVTFNERLMPYIEAKLDGKTDKYLFDLGSASLFSQTEKTARKYIIDKDIINIQGAAIEGGNGIVKLPVNVFKANTFEIGDAVGYKNKPVLYTSLSNENLVGNPIIKDFIITLNFKDNELYFTPIAHAKTTDGWHSFGFNIEYKNGRTIITSLFNGLPAQKAGLGINDEIIAIDNQLLKCANFCDCKSIIDNILQNNSSITLKVKSDNNSKEVKLNKEKIY